MKRFLLLAVLCLFGSLPAKADIFHLTGGIYDVTGDFANLGNSTLGTQGSFGFTFDATLEPGTYDPISGPFASYDVTVRVNGGIAQACASNQIGSMCGRNLHNNPIFYVDDFDGDGIGLMNVLTSGFGTNITISNIGVEVSLPQGFTVAPHVAAVPETSTWIMMLIGFALLLVVKRDNRQPLRRVWRLGYRLQHIPYIA
jgi:hypothetical protein